MALMPRGSKVLVWLVLIAMGASIWGLRRRAMNHFLATQTYEDIYYLPPPQWLTVMSLGYRRALADLIWMRALVYFGDEFQHRGGVQHVFKYGDSLLTLDPDFRRVYGWVGVAGVYTPHEAPIGYIDRSVKVLRRGAQRFPNDGSLAWDTGATIAYELLPRLDKDDPRRESLRQEATEYMQSAARLGAGPEWLVLSNATQLRKLGETERELRHLEEMYSIVRDPDVKAQIEIRLAQLRDEAHAEAFRHANLEFEERRREEFPYVPPALYFFLAEPTERGAGLGDDS